MLHRFRDFSNLRDYIESECANRDLKEILRSGPIFPSKGVVLTSRAIDDRGCSLAAFLNFLIDNSAFFDRNIADALLSFLEVR